MRKYISYIICMIVVCMIITMQITVLADTVDPEKKCDLSVCYSNDDESFSGEIVNIYRVASTSEDTDMELTEEFVSYPVRVNGVTSQAEWKDVASVLSAYISRDKIEPYRSVVTDEYGIAVFSGLETGLYLIGEVTAANDDGSFVFDSFMLHLPVLSDGEYNYDTKINPKGVRFVPSNEQIEYKVLKLWRDSDGVEGRPVSVTVEILKNGNVEDTVTLSGENNWTYSWTAADDGSVWAVVETDVPQEYYVNVTVRETSFVIANTLSQDPTGGDPVPPGTDAPQTGENFPLLWLVVGMCISGMIMLVIGAWSMRGKGNAENK